MNSPAAAAIPTAWPAAIRLIGRWIDRRERSDVLLDTLPRQFSGPERARCQNLVLGVVRHYGRIESALGRLVAHRPRHTTHAALLTAGFELIEISNRSPGERAARAAKIVHHAVARTKDLASPAEARLVNAVIRRLSRQIAEETAPPSGASAESLAEYYSHPAWLIQSWRSQFGAEAALWLLEWNQRPAPVYARLRPVAPLPPDASPRTFPAIPDSLKPSRWPGFLEVESGHWGEVEPLLKSGAIYLQDPAGRLPVDLLAPQRGDNVLDLCAAPGGKSLLITDFVAATPVPSDAPGKGLLVAVDLPGPRIDRLRENLSRAAGLPVALVQANILKNLVPVLREHRLPTVYDAVLLDVPCSNTGVMRHRVDVKWRLQPGDFKKHPRQQLSLLHAAARCVAPGGRLVYSTCSIDAEENEHVIAAFFTSRAGEAFESVSSIASRPWETGHDGGAAFLLRKKP